MYAFILYHKLAFNFGSCLELQFNGNTGWPGGGGFSSPSIFWQGAAATTNPILRGPPPPAAVRRPPYAPASAQQPRSHVAAGTNTEGDLHACSSQPQPSSWAARLWLGRASMEIALSTPCPAHTRGHHMTCHVMHHTTMLHQCRGQFGDH